MTARGPLAASTALALSVLLLGCSAYASPFDGWATATPVDEWPDDEGPPVGECPWDRTAVASPAPASGGDPVAATESNALDPALFWPLIETIPPAPQPADFDAVSSALGGCSLDDIVAFHARLTLALYDLEGPENLAWFEENDPSGLGFVSDDVFLYARCASVLGGEENWRRAVADRTLAWGTDAPDLEGNAEFLLYVAYYAARAQGVTGEDYYDAVGAAVPISFESGSNTERWDGGDG